MLKVILVTTSIASLCLLAVLLNITTPTSIGPFGILLIFVLFYLLSLSVITFFIFYSSKLIRRLSLLFIARKPIAAIEFKKSYYYATVTALVPALYIGMKSVGAVSFYSNLLIAFFAILGCLYVYKNT